MIERNFMRRFFAASLLACSLAGSSFAFSWLDYQGVGNGDNAKMKGTYNNIAYGGTNGISVFSGQIKVKYKATDNGTLSNTFAAYCISPDRALLGSPTGQDPWEILMPQIYHAAAGDNSVNGRIARLVSYGAAANNNSQDMFSISNADDQRASIFQAVLWALVSTNNDLKIDIDNANGINTNDGLLLANRNRHPF
jgi:hypothetical protein